MGEEKGTVKVVMLKSVRSETSTSLTVGYYFVDPFGELGMVYIEVHEASALEAANNGKGLTIRQLYGEDDSDLVNEAVEDYWETFDYTARASATTYENSYTFKKLKPGTQYYVVMAHMATDPEGDGMKLKRYLDDYYRVRTVTQQNSLTISQVTAGSVTVTLSLEDLNVCGEKSAIKLSDEGSKEVTPHELSAAAIEQAVDSQYTATFSVDVSQWGENLVATLVDGNGETIKLTRISNPFYTPGNTPAGGSGGSGASAKNSVPVEEVLAVPPRNDMITDEDTPTEDTSIENTTQEQPPKQEEPPAQENEGKPVPAPEEDSGDSGE